MRLNRIVAGAAMMLSITSCSASMKLGEAVVTMAGETPCFSVPQDPSTEGGIPLFEISVTAHTLRASRADRLQWKMEISPPGASIQTFPDKCFAYGALPPGGVEVVKKPLKSFTVYAVAIEARPEKSNMLAYLALFCMKPDATGKMEIFTMSRSQNHGEGRFDICQKPAT